MNQKTKNTMTLGEFRRMFGVPARTLRYWISTGRIRVLKIDNGRGGFSKRIRRLETLADWVALENAFAKRPARGPCPRLPLPKDKAFRAAVRGFASIMQERGKPTGRGGNLSLHNGGQPWRPTRFQTRKRPRHP
jgi:hypothetical protein